MNPLIKKARLALLATVLGCHCLPAPAQTGALAAAPPAQAAASAPASLMLAVRYWSEAALRANALDHTPPPPGSARPYYEQYGPARSSRALAIYHLALFEALNAVLPSYPGYTGMAQAPSDSSPDAALATAARATLQALYPGQARAVEQTYRNAMLRVGPGRARDNGVETGRRRAGHARPARRPGRPRGRRQFFPEQCTG